MLILFTQQMPPGPRLQSHQESSPHRHSLVLSVIVQTAKPQQQQHGKQHISSAVSKHSRTAGRTKPATRQIRRHRCGQHAGAPDGSFYAGFGGRWPMDYLRLSFQCISAVIPGLKTVQEKKWRKPCNDGENADSRRGAVKLTAQTRLLTVNASVPPSIGEHALSVRLNAVTFFFIYLHLV